MKKTYLFATDTKYADQKLTGAHRRFLELVKSVAKNANVILVSQEIPQLDGVENITIYPIAAKTTKFLPHHLRGAWAIFRKLMQIKSHLQYDYAVSFSPVISASFRMAGIRHIVSLFREDLIGYQRALLASSKRIAYFSLQERIAVKASEKIIVQCANDRKNLIERNEKHCKNLTDKVFVQINNANASWMNTEQIGDWTVSEVPRILFIGNFSDRRKGHFLLLPAAARLLKEGFRFEMLMAGDGAELEACKKQYADHPEIKFLGRVSNMGHYLQQTDFEIVPSLIDSCPNTVLEGLNAGIAVYGTNTGGIPDLLREQEYLFEPNEESVYQFLKEVLTSKRYRADAQKQQKRKQELTFDWGEKIRMIIEA